jgi:hypothetical protein
MGKNGRKAVTSKEERESGTFRKKKHDSEKKKLRTGGNNEKRIRASNEMEQTK